MNTQTMLRRIVLLIAVLTTLRSSALFASDVPAQFPLKTGDRVQWIGSSSTRIGTWCRTMEFMLRTRHPDLNLTFARSTTGGGTFLTGIKNLPVWLSDFKPTVVLFNYGGNDAAPGVKGIPQFKLNMQKNIDIAKDTGARVLLMTHQSGDVRAASQVPFDNRKLYAETMLAFAQENGWTMYDTHHPLEALQLDCQRDTRDFTLNKDRIHLTDSAYVAWGFYLYDCMNPPVVESSAELNVSGRVLRETHCKISSVSAPSSGILEFTRADTVLPLLPPDPIPTGNSLKVAPSTSTGTIKQDAPLDKSKPRSIMQLADGRNADAFFGSLSYATLVPAPLTITVKSTAATGPKMPLALANYALKFGAQLPSRKFVPLEKYSRYMLKIEGLNAGEYDVSCDGKPIGRATDKELAAGVNLNTLLLDSKNPAPWGELVKALWLGKRLDEIGKTQWKFRVEKK